MNKETLKKAIEETFKYSNLEPLDFLSDDDMQDIIDCSTGHCEQELDVDELINYFRELMEEQQGFLDEEIIYYSVAMDYLKEHDQSLSDSIQIAVEMGYELDNINSELLASLLKSQHNKEEFYSLIEDLERELS